MIDGTFVGSAGGLSGGMVRTAYSTAPCHTTPAQRSQSPQQPGGGHESLPQRHQENCVQSRQEVSGFYTGVAFCVFNFHCQLFSWYYFDPLVLDLCDLLMTPAGLIKCMDKKLFNNVFMPS